MNVLSDWATFAHLAASSAIGDVIVDWGASNRPFLRAQGAVSGPLGQLQNGPSPWYTIDTEITRQTGPKPLN